MCRSRQGHYLRAESVRGSFGLAVCGSAAAGATKKGVLFCGRLLCPRSPTGHFYYYYYYTGVDPKHVGRKPYAPLCLHWALQLICAFQRPRSGAGCSSDPPFYDPSIRIGGHMGRRPDYRHRHRHRHKWTYGKQADTTGMGIGISGHMGRRPELQA